MRLIVLPGMDGLARLLDEFEQALPDSVEMCAFRYPADVPLSYAQLAQRVRSEIEPNIPYVLLGESFSGPIACQLAAERIGKLRGLILCASFVRSPYPQLWPLASAFASMARPALLATLLPLAFRKRPSKELLESLRKTIREVKPAVWTMRIRQSARVDCREDLWRVSVPVLNLAASEDRLLPGYCQRLISNTASEVETRIIEGPHFILQCRAVEAARHIQSFISGLR